MNKNEGKQVHVHQQKQAPLVRSTAGLQEVKQVAREEKLQIK